jgi:hypothetical protein
MPAVPQRKVLHLDGRLGLRVLAPAVKIDAVLDPAPFAGLRDIPAGRVTLTVATPGAALKASISPKSVRSTAAAVERYGGPDNVRVSLRGRLGPDGTVSAPQLFVNPKTAPKIDGDGC